mgnify:CR=1 FL=1
MVPHPPEQPPFSYDLAQELAALRQNRALREIPGRSSKTLLAATWNLTNFGVQVRSDNDLALMAEIISWFDLVAIQEVADSLDQLRQLLTHLPASYRIILSDTGGNDERAGFIYHSRKLKHVHCPFVDLLVLLVCIASGLCPVIGACASISPFQPHGRA